MTNWFKALEDKKKVVNKTDRLLCSVTMPIYKCKKKVGKRSSGTSGTLFNPVMLRLSSVLLSYNSSFRTCPFRMWPHNFLCVVTLRHIWLYHHSLSRHWHPFTPVGVKFAKPYFFIMRPKNVNFLRRMISSINYLLDFYFL